MSLIAAFAGYLLRMILARNLTPIEFGLFYAVFSFVSIFSLFKDFGLGSALVKFIPELQVKKQFSAIKSAIISAFSIQFIASGIIALVLILFSKYLATNYFKSKLAVAVLILIALSYWLDTFPANFAVIFQGFQRIGLLSVVNFLKISSILILTFIFLSLGGGVNYVAVAYAATPLLLLAFFFPFFIKTFPQFIKAKFKISKALILKLLFFGFPILIGSMGGLFIAYTDTIVLTLLRDLKEVAFYNIALPTAMLLWYFPQAIVAILMPMASEMWNRGHKIYLKRGVEMIYVYAIAIITPLILTMVSFPGLILKILFGQQYVAASLALQILAIGTIFYAIALINGHVLIGIGKPKINAKAIVLAAVFNIIANLVLVSMFGFVGAAIATSISYMIILLVTSANLRKDAHITLPIAAWGKIFAASAIFLLTISALKWMMHLNVWAEAAICLIAAAIAYAAILILTKAIDLKEITNLFKTVLINH
jgi:O-antigen/teichoic acid export membrane protein